MADNTLAHQLFTLGLHRYLPTFLKYGFHSWDAVGTINDTDLEAMGVIRGHRRKLQKHFELAAPAGRRPSRGLKRTEPVDTPVQDSTDETRNKVPRRKYKRHPKPDPNAPERPLTAYVRFAKDRRKEFESNSLSFSLVAKKIGVEWQELEASTKNQYLSSAGDDWTRYRKALNQYQNTQEHADYLVYLHDFARKNPNSVLKPPYPDTQHPRDHGSDTTKSPVRPDHDGADDDVDDDDDGDSFSAAPDDIYPWPSSDARRRISRPPTTVDLDSFPTSAAGPGASYAPPPFLSHSSIFHPAESMSAAHPLSLTYQPHFHPRDASHPALRLDTSDRFFDERARSSSRSGGNARLRHALSRALDDHTSGEASTSSAASAVPSMASELSPASQDFFLPSMGAPMAPAYDSHWARPEPHLAPYGSYADPRHASSLYPPGHQFDQHALDETFSHFISPSGLC